MSATMGDREERMRFLLRKSARNRELEPFKEKLRDNTSLTEDELRFMPLEESDPLIEEFHHVYRDLTQDQKLIVTWSESTPIKLVLAELGLRAEASKLYIYFPDARTLGILPLASNLFFPNAFMLLSTAGDCIHAVTHKAISGLTLDFYEEGPTGVTYELIGWGVYQELLEQSIAKLYPQKLVRWTVSRNKN